MISVPPPVLSFFTRCGIVDLTEDTLAPLVDLHRQLAAANSEINLTRVISFEDYWVKHIADSLSILLFFPDLLTGKLVLADVGCGAGFPVLPLAWAMPHSQLTGIDSTQKKITFVNSCCRQLGWPHCRGIARQAREAGRQSGLNGAFDLVVSRAMSDCAKVFKESRGLLKPGAGQLILYKTPSLIVQETPHALREADKFGYMFTVSDPLDLPLEAGTRQFAVFSPKPV